MSDQQISVLVVDDEEDYQRLLSECIAELGYDVRAAGSGRDAIDLGAAMRPDVLVSDWMLQGSIHGLHVSEILRIIDPSIRTILITGYASPDLEEEARRARISSFIEKPFDRVTLQAAVKRAAKKGDPERKMVSFPVIEIDELLNITYTNEDARQLLHIGSETDALALRNYLQIESPLLEAARSEWMEVKPA
ncbi:MAG: response regulator, partial [Bdellovibrionales bacterium]|nr:response regulator [Bdellovibrionales bacterium]